MPYIKKTERVALDVGDVMPQTPGQLNYVITKAAHEYIRNNGLSYTKLNEVYGAMQAAAAEFYRTVIVPYEDRKRQENGSVSLLDEVMEQQG